MHYFLTKEAHSCEEPDVFSRRCKITDVLSVHIHIRWLLTSKTILLDVTALSKHEQLQYQENATVTWSSHIQLRVTNSFNTPHIYILPNRLYFYASWPVWQGGDVDWWKPILASLNYSRQELQLSPAVRLEFAYSRKMAEYREGNEVNKKTYKVVRMGENR
jgi:hypothetical protein